MCTVSDLQAKIADYKICGSFQKYTPIKPLLGAVELLVD